MAEFMWHWTKGTKKVYTLRTDLAEQALKDGLLVLGCRINPSQIQAHDLLE